MTTKDALTSNNLAGAIPEDFVGAVNKNAAKADDELETVPFNGRDVRLQPGNKRSEDVVANRANFAAGDKLLLSPRSGYGLTDAVVEKVGKSNLQFRGWRNTVPILKLSGGLRIRGNMVSVIKGLSSNAKFAPGDVAYCRTFACNARVMSVGTTKSGICNYKVALYDAKGVRTGEAVCSESDLVRRSVRGLKLTGLASGASRACDVAATILEKMVQRNKVDLPLAKKMLRLTQRDFPDARVSVAAAKLNENPPALLSAAKILRAEANRLRAQGKSIKLTTTSYSKWYTVVSYQLSPLRTVIDTLKTTNKLDTSKLGGVIGELNDAARNGTPDVNSARPALKQAVSMLQGVWRDASGKEMTPELKTRLLRTLGQTLNIVSKALRSIEPIEGKSMKAMRAAVKRAPAEALPMIAPLHSKLLMVYRKFIGSPETASLGSLPALAAQWKAVGNKLPDEEQSGVALIVRDLISAYRSFTKEQTKNVAYFLAMALGTANKMVGGSANVPIPAHLRAVKAGADVATPLEQAQHTLTAMSYLVATAVTDDAALQKLLGMFSGFYRQVSIADANAMVSPKFYKQAKPMLSNAKHAGMQAESGAGLARYKPDQRQKLLAEAQKKLDEAGRILSDVGTLWNRAGGKSMRGVKAIDAKEYYEKNKKIPVGSILRVNGKLVQVERANGYVISGYEYKKPQSTNTHVSVDLRNTPATLLSVGNGTFRFARDGNVVFGRRPAN